MSKIRCAVIGAGHLGKIHARILKTLPEFELSVVVESLEAARQAAAETFQVPVDADYRPWIDRVDAVIIATPTKFHHQVAGDFLRAAKHCFVEKPITSDVEQAEQLVAAAQRSKAVLQIGHVERFNPAWTELRSRVHSPRFIECRREGTFTFRSTDVGVVLDLMVHDIDLVASLVRSPVVDVEASGDSWFGIREDVAYARLRFQNGCTAVFQASRMQAGVSRQMRLRSESEIASVDFQTRTVQVTRIDEALQRGEIDVEQMPVADRDQIRQRLGELLKTETVTPEPCDAITAEQRDFADSIREGRRPLVSGVDGLEAVRIATRILDAIEMQAEREASVPAKIRMGSADSLLPPSRLPQRRAG
jgi:predicted dehydrogenase